MPQTETKEFYEVLENVKDFNSIQTDFQKDTDFVKERAIGGASQIEKPLKGKGLLFLDSMIESRPFIQKAVKFTAIGVAGGLALSLLFPPLGIAIMTISAIAGATAIGAKLAYGYTTKTENSYPKESIEIKDEVLTKILKELMEEKFSKDKKGTKQQEEKNGIKDDFKQNTETLIRGTRIEEGENASIGNNGKDGMVNGPKLSFGSIIKDGGDDNSNKVKSVINTNDSGLVAFTKPLNILNPNIKNDAIALKPRAHPKEMQSSNQNIRMKPSKL